MHIIIHAEFSHVKLVLESVNAYWTLQLFVYKKDLLFFVC